MVLGLLRFVCKNQIICVVYNFIKMKEKMCQREVGSMGENVVETEDNLNNYD